MFTGIIQGTAKIVSIDTKLNLSTYIVSIPKEMINGLKTGSSVSNNGCCLTVKKINGNHVSFDVIEETIRVTNLNELIPGDFINIERAAKFSDEIGGHIMSGHISSTAKVLDIINSKGNYQIWFELHDLSLMQYIFCKGFIGIEGASLTIGEVSKTCFCVYLIPETLSRTTFKNKRLGDRVNIEIDLQTQAIVDTINRILLCKSKNVSNLTEHKKNTDKIFSKLF